MRLVLDILFQDDLSRRFYHQIPSTSGGFESPVANVLQEVHAANCHRNGGTGHRVKAWMRQRRWQNGQNRANDSPGSTALLCGMLGIMYFGLVSCCVLHQVDALRRRRGEIRMDQYVSSLIRGVGWCDLPRARPKIECTTTEHLGREPVSSAPAPDQSRAANLASDRIRHIPVGTLLPEQVQGASSIRPPTESRVLSVTLPRPLPTKQRTPSAHELA